MKGFEPVTFEWDGERYTVAADHVLELIAEIEDGLRGRGNRNAFAVLTDPAGVPLSRLAMAYGNALRYAGAAVTPSDVYLAIEGGMSEGSPDAALRVQQHVLALMAVMAPQTYRKFTGAAGDGEKKTAAAA